MWHASLSLRSGDSLLRSPGSLERAAASLLAGVGGDREWWWWNPTARVGHLRIGLTADEAALVPADRALIDAGESGPERRRTVAR